MLSDDGLINSYMFCETRLIGLVCQGSTPWVFIGIVVLIVLVFIKHYINLSENQSYRKEAPMINNLKPRISIAVVQTLWTLVTNITAGVLPA